MKILIDTHIAIWAVTNNPKLPNKAKSLILDEANKIYYSTASIWEVTIKHMLHPDQILVDGRFLEKCCKESQYIVLPVLSEHCFALETLKYPKDAPRHNDPFDRMMIAQAKAEEIMFLTQDSLIPNYGEPFIISAS